MCLIQCSYAEGSTNIRQNLSTPVHSITRSDYNNYNINDNGTLLVYSESASDLESLVVVGLFLTGTGDDSLCPRGLSPPDVSLSIPAGGLSGGGLSMPGGVLSIPGGGLSMPGGGLSIPGGCISILCGGGLSIPGGGPGLSIPGGGGPGRSIPGGGGMSIPGGGLLIIDGSAQQNNQC